MAGQHRYTPTPGYRYRPPQRILPRGDFRPTSLHNRMLPQGGAVKSREAEYCPVCLGRRISERMAGGRPVWHCDCCGNEW